MSKRGPAPRVRMRDTELKPVDDPLTLLLRVGRLVFVLVAPIAALVAVLTALVLSRFKKLRPSVFVLLGIAAVVASFVLGGFRAWFMVYREIWSLLGTEGLLSAREVIPAYLSESWRDILISRLWLSVPVGFLVGAVASAARARYAPKWRTEKVEKRSDRSTAKAMQRVNEWPQKDARELGELLVRLGINQHTGKPWDLLVSALRHHGMLVGPSGFGKTTTLIEIMRGLLVAPAAQPFRIGVTFLTMKPDPAITNALGALAELAGRGFHVITEDGGGEAYNPLKRGTPAQRRNILMEAETNAANGGFSEPHYQRSGSRFTLLALRALERACLDGMTYSHGRVQRPWLMDLEHLTRMMRFERMQEIADAGSDARLSADLADYFDEVQEDKSAGAGAGGMRSRFAVIAEGAAGETLRERSDGLDLRAAIQAGDVVVFDLDAARDMEAAQYVGNLAIADWTAAMADLGEQSWHGDSSNPDRLQMLIVDEFSALGGSGLRGALARTRGQGGAVILSTQSWGEITEQSSEGFRANLVTNTSVKLLHQVEEGAEDLASLVGTKEAMKETTQVFEDRDLMGSQTRASGQGSLREVETFKVHPNELKNLRPGEIIALVRNPQEVAHVKIRRTAPAQMLAAAAHRGDTSEETDALDERNELPEADAVQSVKTTEKDSAEAQGRHGGSQSSKPAPTSAWVTAAKKVEPKKGEDVESLTAEDDAFDMPIREDD